MEISPHTSLNSSFPPFYPPYPYDSGYRLIIPSSQSSPTVETPPEESFSPLPDANTFKIDDLLDFSCHAAGEDDDSGDADDDVDDEEEESGVGGALNQADIVVQTLASSAVSIAAGASSLQGELSQPEGASHDQENASANSNLPQEAPYLHAQADSYGLCVPPDELADQLEWLSAFNEDSSYSGDRKLASLVSSGGLCNELSEEGEGSNASALAMASVRLDRFQSSSPVSVLEPNCGFSYILASTGGGYVPSRARSKRSRNHSRTWPSFDMLTIPTLLDNRLMAGEGESPVFVGARTNNCGTTDPPPTKKPKKGPSGSIAAASTKSAAAAFEASQRRCSHCLVQKTPQWRAGPMGPKTLCNACGVRYKSGRLVPEYRPAGSPSFVSEVHSNSHKKILEMRRLKEVEEVQVYSTGKETEDDNYSDEEEAEEDEEENDGGFGHDRAPMQYRASESTRGMKESSFSGSNSCGSMVSACVGSSSSGGAAGDPSSIDSNAPVSNLSSVDCHGSCILVERRASNDGMSACQEESFLSGSTAGEAVEEDSRQEVESVGSF